MKLPTIKQLRYFISLEKHQHFGNAAKACFVSQSAFSVAIKELELQLGAQLVDRTNKSVTITRTGREIANHARHCLRDIEYLAEVAQNNQKPLSGRLNLGVIPTIAPFILPDLLPSIRNEYPELKLYLREDTTQSLHDLLIDGELDLIMIALPYKLSNVEVLPLFKDRFSLACHKHSSLINPDNYSLNNLPKESVLLLEDGHCLRDHALSACKIRNQDTVSRFAASSLLTLVSMVDSDIGITYLTEMARNSSLLQNTDINTYPLDEKSFREIGLAWRKGSARVDEFKLLGETIQRMQINKA
ncbi:MAG: LysR family hydrogen peroxide-inducible transcriptional activator [Cocleimonas sp.]|jgi:LysR family hydrogen peroxide-inducible transcriptional activator